MATSLARAAAALVGLLLPGCVTGLLYTDVTRPLMRNLRATPVGVRHGQLGVEQLQDPFFTGLSATWDTNAIGDIAKQFGLAEIYSADLRTFSLLFGLFSQQTVIVQGR
jgi:hypothetical protein